MKGRGIDGGRDGVRRERGEREDEMREGEEGRRRGRERLGERELYNV